MSKRKVRLSINSNVYPARPPPYGHSRLTRKQRRAYRAAEQRLRELRKNPPHVVATPPIIRKKNPPPPF